METRLAQDPIIVFGAPRSGTTYLQRILSAHPEVFISDEVRVFAWLHHALKLTTDHRLLANDGEGIVMRLRAVLPELIRDFYSGHAPDARYWGDKNPHYADPFNKGCLELIAELFPASRFIHIIRDGRDVVSSLARKQWSEDQPWVSFRGAHTTWTHHVNIGCAFGGTLDAKRYFELRYEDLVANDVSCSRKLFEFLEVDFHPLVDAFCRDQQQARTPFSGPTRDFEKGVSHSEWAETFSPEDQVRSLNHLSRPLVRYGYETQASLDEIRKSIAARLALVEPDNG